MSENVVSGVLLIVNVVCVVVGCSLVFFVIVPRKEARRPYRRVQRIALGIVSVGLLAAIVNAVIGFSS